MRWWQLLICAQSFFLRPFASRMSARLTQSISRPIDPRHVPSWVSLPDEQGTIRTCGRSSSGRFDLVYDGGAHLEIGQGAGGELSRQMKRWVSLPHPYMNEMNEKKCSATLRDRSLRSQRCTFYGRSLPGCGEILQTAERAYGCFNHTCIQLT